MRRVKEIGDRSNVRGYAERCSSLSSIVLVFVAALRVRSLTVAGQLRVAMGKALSSEGSQFGFVSLTAKDIENENDDEDRDRF